MSVAVVNGMSVVGIRDFMKFRPIDLLHGYKTNNNVLFEDGVCIKMDYKEVILTRYILILLEAYPEIAIASSYNISNYYTNGIFTSKTINNCLEVLLKDIVNMLFVPANNYGDLPLVYKTMYTIFNLVYNDIGYGGIEYSTSTNIVDYLDVQLHPDLIKSIQKVNLLKTEDSIKESYAILDNLLTNDPRYINNSISKAYVSGMVNQNQIKQILAPRGYITEIDGSLFKYPVASSFTLGMNSIYDMAIESRSGAKALHLSNKAVQDSEYLARELQLVAMVVERLIYGDCGSKDYMSWYVRPDGDGNKSDLKNLVGKRYYNEITGKEEIITSKHKHLEGTNIKLRSAIKCKLKNSKEICSACFGELSTNVHAHSGLGHICTSSITQKITQSILSTKHLTTSASSGTIKLVGDAVKFFTIKEKDGYAFKPNVLDVPDTKVSIIISQEEAFGIKDLKSVVDIVKLDPTRISLIESMVMLVETKKGNNYYPIIVKDGAKYGSFTHKFLEYIITNGINLDSQDRYIIDLSNWKMNSAILKLPALEFSYLALAKEVKKILKNIKLVKGTKAIDTPETLLQKLFDLINNKLDVNIALMEVLIYSFTINGMEDSDYKLGRHHEDQEVADIRHIVPNRSLGGAYAWEFVVQNMSSPTAFLSKNRIDHPLDVLLKPNEVIKDYM